jgi:hypothetical protein
MQNREDGGQWSDLPAVRPDPGSVSPGKNALPTLALLITATIMLGAVGGWFLGSRGEPDAPVVAMLSPEQLPDAIPTLNAGAQQTARADLRECRFPVGFITVATPGNPAGGTVSFRTSKYQSPPFHVTDQPQQIAIPSPLPESGGVDLLAVDGDAKGLLVSLHPTARMEPVNGTAMVKVIWRPRPPCKS